MRIRTFTRMLPTAALSAATAGALMIDSPIAQALAPVLLAATILWRGPRRRLLRSRSGG
jgi:hypothetical protein